MIPVSFRAATMADAAALAVLRTEIFDATGHGRPVSEADVIGEFTEFAPPETILLAVADGELAGWAWSAEGAPPGRRFLPGGVLPAHRGLGIGRHLLAWQVERFVPGNDLVVSCRSTDQATQALLRRFGLRPVREFLWMTRDVELPIAAPTTDLTIAAYRPEDEYAVWFAHQEGFADHFGFTPTAFEEWADRFPRSKRFRPDLSFVAWDDRARDDRAPDGDDRAPDGRASDGGEVVGFALCYDGPTVVIEQVATRKAWRGRGAAGALLAAVFGAARSAGVRALALNVDAQNATGAVRLYERAGFVQAFRRVQYGRPQ